MCSPSTAAAATRRALRYKALRQMAAGIGVVCVPVSVWWYWSVRERHHRQERERTKMRLPNGVSDTYDYLIAEKCQAGDVILFDRRCERCVTPWAALACSIAKLCLTNATITDRNIRSIDSGRYDHVGLIVPGQVDPKRRAEAYNATNLLLLEATPKGVVARPLKERLEQSTAHSVLLLQLCCPGEQRNNTNNNNHEPEVTPTLKAAQRARDHVERQLTTFRDRYIQAAAQNKYHYLHSTVTLGGALAYQTGLQLYSRGPVSPAAFLVLTGLQQAAAAPSLNDVETRGVKPEDFLRDYRFTEKDAVRLRPGYRFLVPIPLKQGTESSSR